MAIGKDSQQKRSLRNNREALERERETRFCSTYLKCQNNHFLPPLYLGNIDNKNCGISAFRKVYISVACINKTDKFS
jgi:hypothetical protein